jgi:hypothetical protein
VVNFGAGVVTGGTYSPQSGSFLPLGQQYFPGWKINGDEEIIKANSCFCHKPDPPLVQQNGPEKNKPKLTIMSHSFKVIETNLIPRFDSNQCCWRHLCNRIDRDHRSNNNLDLRQRAIKFKVKAFYGKAFKVEA